MDGEWISGRLPNSDEFLRSYNPLYHAAEFIVDAQCSPRATTMYFDGVSWYRNDGIYLGTVNKWAMIPDK